MSKAEIIIAIISSTAAVKIVEAIIKFVEDKKNSPLKKLTARINELERGNLRTQMLFLMKCYPDDTFQLMECAQRYFVDLKGDWWLSGMFERHCNEHSVPLPVWFNKPQDS